MPAPPAVRRFVYLLASFAPAWALVATFTGGVGWVIGPLRLSSVDDWEETEFRSRFGPHSRSGRLDWEPLARVPGEPEVRIYDLAAGAASQP